MAHIPQPVFPANPNGEDWKYFLRQFKNYCSMYEIETKHQPTVSVANACDFSADKAGLMRDVFVIGLSNHRLVERLLAEDPTSLDFETALRKDEALEIASSDRSKLSMSETGTATGHVNKVSHSGSTGSSTPRPSQPRARETSQVKTKKCFRCGSNTCTHMASYDQCPALRAECRNCHKRGHFPKVCQSKAQVRAIGITDETTDDDDI